MKSKRKYFGITALLRSAERRFFIKHGLISKDRLSKISSMLTITSYLSKSLKILFTFVVPFLITVVFWPRFLKIGKMLSYMAIRNTPTNQR